ELLAHQLPEVDRIVLVERGRQVVFLNLAFAIAGVDRAWKIAEIEGQVDRYPERLQAAAARQLQRGLDAAIEQELILVSRGVERQIDRRDDPERISRGGDRLRLVGLFEPDLLGTVPRRADPCQIQRQHEPFSIPYKLLIADCKLLIQRRLRLFRPRLGNEQLLEETDGEAIGHPRDEVPDRGVEAFLIDRAGVEVVARPLAELLPQSRQDT